MERSKIDIYERLDGYNPPDRTIDRDLNFSIDFNDAKNEIKNLRKELEAVKVRLENAVKEDYIRIHILRNWNREKIERFAKHLLGEKCQKCELLKGGE